MTQRECLVAFLESAGCKPAASRSKKYLVFSHPELETYYYVGVSGAIRKGKTVAESVSLPASIKSRYLKTGEDLLKK